MEKTMYITGMMCPHCEARVKQILEGVDGVDSAVCSHEKGTAVLTLSEDTDDNVLRTIIEKEGYTVTGIENS